MLPYISFFTSPQLSPPLSFSPLKSNFHLSLTSPFFAHFISIPTSNFNLVPPLFEYASPINLHCTKILYLRDLHKLNSSPLILTPHPLIRPLPLKPLEFLNPFVCIFNLFFPPPFKLNYPTHLTLPYTPFFKNPCAPSLFPPPLKPYPNLVLTRSLFHTKCSQYITYTFVNRSLFFIIIVINYSFIFEYYIFRLKGYHDIIHIFLKVLDIFLLKLYSYDRVFYLLFYHNFSFYYALISCTIFFIYVYCLPFVVNMHLNRAIDSEVYTCLFFVFYDNFLLYFFPVILCFKKISDSSKNFTMSGNHFSCKGTSTMDNRSLQGLLLLGYRIIFLLSIYLVSQLINQSHP